jgi:hypothetical protein
MRSASGKSFPHPRTAASAKRSSSLLWLSSNVMPSGNLVIVAESSVLDVLLH